MVRVKPVRVKLNPLKLLLSLLIMVRLREVALAVTHQSRRLRVESQVSRMLREVALAITPVLEEAARALVVPRRNCWFWWCSCIGDGCC